MQFIDLQIQYQHLKAEIDQAIGHVLSSSHYIMGEEVQALETKLAAYVGKQSCVTCANGTEALSLALMAYNIGKGDAVFVPTYTFYASAETVSLAGATPVFVDIDVETFNLSCVDLERATQEVVDDGKLKPRAILAVDLFGLPADYASIRRIAEQYNLLIIEDGAQGFGGSVDGKMACSFGDVAITSFFPAKPLGCYGDGGALFTAEERVKEQLESLRIHGKGSDKYDNIRVGMNSRLDTIQAAILLVKLKAFQEYELDARNQAAQYYNEQLSGYVKTPAIPKGYRSSYAQYSILCDTEQKRDALQRKLKEQGIPTMVYYKKCLHEQTAYQNNHWIDRGFPHAEFVSQRILNLPIHPYIQEELPSICQTIRQSLL